MMPHDVSLSADENSLLWQLYDVSNGQQFTGQDKEGGPYLLELLADATLTDMFQKDFSKFRGVLGSLYKRNILTRPPGYVEGEDGRSANGLYTVSVVIKRGDWALSLKCDCKRSDCEWGDNLVPLYK